MPITHKWEGTTLVITSDSGTSSCDLQGARGPQGSPGDCVASDTAMLGGLPAENYALKTYADSTATAAAANMPKNAYNILHNSYFVNPVNQRGQTTYTGAGYTIDRWRTSNQYATVSVGDGFVLFKATGGTAIPRQIVPTNSTMFGKTYTAAVCTNAGIIKIATGTLTNEATGTETTFASVKINDGATLRLVKSSDVSTISFRIDITDGNSLWLKWAALYEGEYTVETLPQYVYKGYAAELAECERFYRRINAAELMPYSAFISGGNKRLAVNFGYANIRTATPECVMSDDFLLVVRAGTGGYSSITGSAGAKPASVVNGKASSIQGGVSAYFEFESQFTEPNNMAVVAVIKQGYLEIKAEL